jgi:hypothetical protein
LDVLYADNVVGLLHRNIYFGHWLSHRLFGRSAHNSFSSRFGSTLHHSFHAPSECGGLWTQWLAGGDRRDPPDEIPEPTAEALRRFFYSVINRFDRPLMFKNLKAGQIMPQIIRCMPGTKFIFVRRDPFFMAQSMWKAKRHSGVPKDELFGTGPANWRQLRQLPEPEQIVKQLHCMEMKIATDSRVLPTEQFMTVHYGNLCNEPQRVMAALREFIGPDVKLRTDALVPRLEPSQRITLSPTEAGQLRREIEKCDWGELAT